MEGLINIIIPVFNVERYIGEFFESILKQEYLNYRLFVVDDCSTDNSRDIIGLYKRIFCEKMNIIYNPQNLGLSKSRNVGLEESEKYESEYTIFLDPDDWIEDIFLQDLYMTAEQVQADICISGMTRFDDETNRNICVEMVNFPHDVIDKPQEFEGFAYINPSVCNKLFKSSIVRGLRFRDIKRSEDTCYFFEALIGSKRVIFTNKPSYHYRIHGSSLSGTISQDKLESMYMGFESIYPIFLEGPGKKYQELFESQIFIRVACGGVCRLAFSDIKSSKNNIEVTYNFMNNLMPNWSKNRYLSFFSGAGEGIKVKIVKMCALLYRLNLFYMFIHFYYFYNQILKKDSRL